jgi:hypothetical protein
VLGIFLNRRNVILMLMAIELILLAVNINLVAFSAYLGDLYRPGLRDVRADRRRGRGGDRPRDPRHLLPPPRLDRGRRRQPDARLMTTSLELIVFLPMLAAIVAGLGGRWIGKTAAKVVTTGACSSARRSAGRSSSVHRRQRAATSIRCSTGFARATSGRLGAARRQR